MYKLILNLNHSDYRAFALETIIDELLKKTNEMENLPIHMARNSGYLMTKVLRS